MTKEGIGDYILYQGSLLISYFVFQCPWYYLIFKWLWRSSALFYRTNNIQMITPVSPKLNVKIGTHQQLYNNTPHPVIYQRCHFTHMRTTFAWRVISPSYISEMPSYSYANNICMTCHFTQLYIRDAILLICEQHLHDVSFHQDGWVHKSSLQVLAASQESER